MGVTNGNKSGISYEVLGPLAVQKGHVVLVSCEDQPDTNLAAILRRIFFRISLKGHEVRRASETPIRVFVVRLMFFAPFDCALLGKIRDRVITFYSENAKVCGVDFI